MKPRFMLTVEAVPDASDPEGVRRLRAMLKAMLRRHRLRCVEVRPEQAEAAEAERRAQAEAVGPSSPRSDVGPVGRAKDYTQLGR